MHISEINVHQVTDVQKVASVVNHAIIGPATENPSSIVSKSAEVTTIQAVVPEPVPVDYAKVAAIKAEIAAGTFKINPGDIADGLIMSTADFQSTLRM